MIGLDDLYHDLILAHAKNPRNFGEPEKDADDYCKVQGYNPMCGDKIQVWLLIEDDAIVDIKFTGKACAICTASASLMTEAVKDLSPDDAKTLFETFHSLLTEQADVIDDPEKLGDLAALEGVLKYPMRVKCATLPWHAFKAALEKHIDAPISTE